MVWAAPKSPFAGSRRDEDILSLNFSCLPVFPDGYAPVLGYPDDRTVKFHLDMILLCLFKEHLTYLYSSDAGMIFL